MFIPLEIVFYIMIFYTVYCVSLACRTYVKEMKNGGKK